MQILIPNLTNKEKQLLFFLFSNKKGKKKSKNEIVLDIDELLSIFEFDNKNELINLTGQLMTKIVKILDKNKELQIKLISSVFYDFGENKVYFTIPTNLSSYLGDLIDYLSI